MSLTKRSFLAILAGALCVSALGGLAWWHWGRQKPQPPNAPFTTPAVSRGNPGWDTDAVGKAAADLFSRDDYAGLEKLVGEIKAKGYNIRQSYPELSAFYSVFIPKISEDQQHWLDRKTKLEGWAKAMPESVTAQIVTADWYIGYAWKARGTGYASTVTPEGWKLLGEFLEKATETLHAVPPEKIDDPQYYRLWITVALGQAWPYERMEDCLKKGVAVGGEFYPLYSAAACFLLPKWYGKPGDCARFASEAAANFPEEDGQMLYALLACEESGEFGDRFFAASSFDYPRIKRAYETEAAKNEVTKFGAQNSLCFLACIAEDWETAKGLFLDLGSTAAKQCFGGPDAYLRLRKAAGADDEIAKTLEIEQTGALEEAEKTWLSFHPDLKTNPWLKSFYLRQGMETKLRQSGLSNAKGCLELLDSQVTKDMDALANLSRLGPLVGMWEKSEAAALAFDRQRPWNLTGKITLWLCALHRGDASRAEELQSEFAALKTDRPAYKAAQAVVAREKTWPQALADLKKEDPFLAQAALAVALHYVTRQQPGEARNVVRDVLPLCRDNYEKTVLESFLFGSLSRSLESAHTSAEKAP